jgi:hypothetical protein
MNKEINPNILISSTLQVKASGVDVSNDLLLQEGKSIAELLNDQENHQKNTKTSK